MKSALIMVFLVVVAAATGPAFGRTSRLCRQASGWQRAKDLKPSPIPYQDPLTNQAIQIGEGRWSWNGKRITEAVLMRYLNQAKAMNPIPLTLIQFFPGLDCRKKLSIQSMIARAGACATGGSKCVEGTDDEYRRARREAAWNVR